MFACGAGVAELGGPLPAYHIAKSESEEDIVRMLEQIAKLLGVIPQNLSKVQSRLKRAVELAKPPIGPAQKKSETTTDNMGWDETDIVTALGVWLEKNKYDLDNRIITFSKLDSQLQLPVGSASKYLQEIAEQRDDIKTLRRGTATILFKGPGVDF